MFKLNVRTDFFGKKLNCPLTIETMDELLAIKVFQI